MLIPPRRYVVSILWRSIREICSSAYVRSALCAGAPSEVSREPNIVDAASTHHATSSAAACPMRYENQKLEGLTFDLDDDEIIGCHLVDCRILLGGKRLPIFSDNRSQDCNFEFSSSALVTVQVLRQMLKIPGLKDLVLIALGLLPHQEPTLH